MQLTAKLIQVLPMQTGVGKNGEWKRQEIILETTDGQYPRKVCISIWGDKINETMLQVGKTLRIDFDIDSREYNGRWFTNLKAWKIEVAADAHPIENQRSAILPHLSASDAPLDSSGPAAAMDDDNDLPF